MRGVGLAAGAAAGSTFLRALDAHAKPAKTLDVVIVGAGLAGLCAAYELERRGHRCVVLEAEHRHLGGRVRTLRFDGGLYGEAGAMRIPQRHELTRHYVREFGLSLRPFVQSNPLAYYHVRGERQRIRDVERIRTRFTLSESERTASPDDLWNRTLVRRLKSLTDAERADLSATIFATPTVRALDAMSLEQLLEAEGLSAEAIELLASTYGMETLLASAATEHLREEHEQVWTQAFDEIVGGTDRLPAAFAARLQSKPRMGCEVVRIEHDTDRARATAWYRIGGKLEHVRGDFVLCTVPFSVLTRVAIHPPLSAAKQRAIRQLNYDSATKVLAVTRRRFWEMDDGIYGGGSYTDLPTGVTYYPADNAQAKDPRVARGPGVMLASYTWGQPARRLAALPTDLRARTALAHLTALHPQLKQAGIVRETASWSWDNHRFSAGAFAWFMPGQHTNLHRHIVAPEGRLLFAGEHTSLAHTWMQGALESAVRAVGEILAADSVKSARAGD